MRSGITGVKVLGALGLVVLLAARAAPTDAPLADAAMRGDVEAVRTLLEGGADVDAPQGDGMTALHWAADLDNVEMVEMLVAAGARVEATTRVGSHTPLHVAAELGNAGAIKALVAAGADVHAITSLGSTALHYAAQAGSAEAIRTLLDHGADVNAGELVWGQTPLIYAASRNQVEAIQALLEGGADISITTMVLRFRDLAKADLRAGEVRDSVLAAFRAEAPDPRLWQPTLTQVQAAVKAARAYEAVQPLEPHEVVHIDLDKAQTQGREFTPMEKAGYQGGMTALIHAARAGHLEAALALLEGGADINQVGAGELQSPLLIAMYNGHFDLGLELLKRGADPNLATYSGGVTPLYAVINQRWVPRSRYPHQQAQQQQRHTHLETMEELLKSGADTNVRLTMHLWHFSYNFGGVGIDFWGATPFFRAAHALDIPAMKLLIEYGADPNIPTKVPGIVMGDGINDGMQDPSELERLSRKDQSGLPPVVSGGPGLYPIHAAAGNSGPGAGRAGNYHSHVPDGWIPALKYLVEELGADVTLRDHLGYSTIHGAAGRGMNDVILYLVEHGADPLSVARSGQTTVDMANSPSGGLTPFFDTIKRLEGLGAKNNHNCKQC